MTLEEIQKTLNVMQVSIEELKTEIDRNKQKEKDLLEGNLTLLKRLDDANHSTTLYYNDLISIRTHLKGTVKQVLQAEGLENKFKLYEDFCNELALKLPLDPIEE